MYCKNCGRELAENEKYCAHCGTPTNEDLFESTSLKVFALLGSEPPLGQADWLTTAN